MPDLACYFHKAFRCDVQFSSLVEGNHQSHYLLALEVLPDSIGGHDDELVLAAEVELQALGLACCAGFYACFVSEGTGHCKSGHRRILHPHSQRPQILTSLVLLTEDPTSKLQDPFSFVRPFWFLIHRKRHNLPLVVRHSIVKLKIDKGGLAVLAVHLLQRLDLLGLAGSCHLPYEDRSGISNIEADDLALVDEDHHDSRATQLGIDFAVQEFFVGLAEEFCDFWLEFRESGGYGQPA